MTVRSLLKGKGRFVPSIGSGTTVLDVVDQLEVDDSGALVVTDDNLNILGIISEREIVRGIKTRGRDVLDLPIEQLMHTDVVTCDIEEPVSRILELMHEHQVLHVPITEKGDLCGIITMLDVVKYRLNQLEKETEALKSYVSGQV